MKGGKAGCSRNWLHFGDRVWFMGRYIRGGIEGGGKGVANRIASMPSSTRRRTSRPGKGEVALLRIFR